MHPSTRTQWFTGVFQVVIDRSALHEVGDFLAHRIDDDVRHADRSGDGRALSYAIGRRDLLAVFRRDIDSRPWAHAEVGRYLLRTARLYRGHPDYREWWD